MRRALPPSPTRGRKLSNDLISDNSDEWSDDSGVRDTSSRSRSASGQRDSDPLTRLRTRLSTAQTVQADDSDYAHEPPNRSHRYSHSYPSVPRRHSTYGTQSSYSAGGQMNPYTAHPFVAPDRHFPRHYSNDVPPPPPAEAYSTPYYDPYATGHDFRNEPYDCDPLYNAGTHQAPVDAHIEDLRREVEKLKLQTKREAQQAKRWREKAKEEKAERAAAQKRHEEKEREKRRERSRDRKYEQLKTELEEMRKTAASLSEARSTPRESSRGSEHNLKDFLQFASLIGRSPLDQPSMVSSYRDYDPDRSHQRPGYWRARPRAPSFNDSAGYPDEAVSQKLDHVIYMQSDIQKRLAHRFDPARHVEDRYTYEHDQVPHAGYHTYPPIKHYESRTIDQIRSPTEHSGPRASYPYTPPSTRESGSNLSSRPESSKSRAQRGRTKHHGRRRQSGIGEAGELFDVPDEDEERPFTPKKGIEDKPRRRKHGRKSRRYSDETDDEEAPAVEGIDYRHVEPRKKESKKTKARAVGKPKTSIREKSQKGNRSRNASVHKAVLAPKKSQDRLQSESEVEVYPPRRSRRYTGGHEKYSRSRLRDKSVPPAAPSVPQSSDDDSSGYTSESSDDSHYVRHTRRPDRLLDCS
ncbi:hypothetical protein F5Y18DRAFT_397159 [Xylariaceae sp. FL1019]|nr:hypothetical protein F5Y18DRAFT_397159 [Xylariaceae sp. FL1019]